jgi:hypothetical protein
MVCSKISASGAQWVFANGKATIVASGSSQQGIYQAVNVVAGQKYSIDMVASSDTPLVNTWFEVYVLNTAPVTGQDVAERLQKHQYLGWLWNGQIQRKSFVCRMQRIEKWRNLYSYNNRNRLFGN